MVISRHYTIEDLLALEDSRHHYELINGEIRQKVSPGTEHARIVGNVAGLLWTHAVAKGLGQIYVGDPLIQFSRDPELVLAPDIAVLTANRVPAEESAYMRTPPDITIEIVSPGNRSREIEGKVAVYLEGGVRQVWIIHPRRRKVTVYRPGNDPKLFTDDQEIDCSPELPGLMVPVAVILDGPRAAAPR
jgi:Uma2 family endonuclease